MRIPIVLALIILWPFLATADLKWNEFAVSAGENMSMTVGGVAVTIKTRAVQDVAFREDYLVLTVHSKGQREVQKWFTSSYGAGAVAVEDGVLFLKYGIGRGTSARDEHIKVLRLDKALAELVDVQTSYYVDSSDPNTVGPDLVEYQVKFQTSLDYATITFWTPTRHPGLPSEKIVKLRNGD